MMSDALQLVKILAGPTAVIIASLAATTITAILGWKQVKIAEAQAATARAQKDISKFQLEIAYDKLKHDLFDKRYEIYIAAKSAIERVIRTGTERAIDDRELLAMRIKMDESGFFFPAREVALLEAIDGLITQHEVARLTRERENAIDNIRVAQADIMGDAITKLSAIHRTLAAQIAPELGFAQLTARAAYFDQLK